MTVFVFAWVAGVVILVLLGVQALADGHPKAWRQRRADARKPYTGRHRAVGLSTDQQVADTAVMFLPDLDEAPLCPPTYPSIYRRYRPYETLRPSVLDTRAAIEQARVRPVVDLEALKVYSPYGTAETVDEWAGAVT